MWCRCRSWGRRPDTIIRRFCRLAGDGTAIEVDCLACHPTGLLAGKVDTESTDIGRAAQAFHRDSAGQMLRVVPPPAVLSIKPIATLFAVTPNLAFSNANDRMKPRPPPLPAE